ncbi:hypothetical protein ADIWIN_0154 [Winogradskyella psychrotolerans RS-3]|uniref:Uncharacterized protein n=1 Tax=Winogradskyella psychrotolerans RS-3 TaxID=641526 RepID=S7VWY4_9FLAO|nr:hypothetical protein ADIWIN_0154 [Winogradskyella psychrotolerans RS-3]
MFLCHILRLNDSVFFIKLKSNGLMRAKKSIIEKNKLGYF